MQSDLELLTRPGVCTEAFFGPDTRYEFREAIYRTTEQILSFLDNEKYFSGEQPEVLRDQPEISLKNISPHSIDQVLGQVKRAFLDHTVAYHHPNYVSHLNCPILIPSIAAELMATSINTAIETWDQNSTGTFIEQEVIRWICSHMQYNTDIADGVFTSGGTQSNFMALLAARDSFAFSKYGINLKENGWSEEVSKFRIFCSEKAHFSIRKNAALLGLGYNSVIPVAVDEYMSMKPEALRAAIESEKTKGFVPIAVVATMGTTDFGSFDPLTDIADITDEFDLWLHADGAYGGCYVLTDTHKHLLHQCKRADSITVDFHKTLYQPVCASAFLLKDKLHFQYFSHFADYLNPADNRDESMPDLIEKSIQTTRRFDAFKVWFSLKTTGEKEIAKSLEKVHYLTRELYNSLKDDADFEMAHKPTLSTLVFRYKYPGATDEQMHNAVNSYIKNQLFRSGKAAVASTKINDTTYLKFTLLDPSHSLEGLKEIIEMIRNTGLVYKVNN